MNVLKELKNTRGISEAFLAKQIGISRQRLGQAKASGLSDYKRKQIAKALINIERNIKTLRGELRITT